MMNGSLLVRSLIKGPRFFCFLMAGKGGGGGG